MMNKIIKISILTIFLFANIITIASAGDARVNVDVEQSIIIDSVEVSSGSGTAELIIGSVIANGDSRISGDIVSEIEVGTVVVQTTSGTARVLIGTVRAGN